MVQVPDRLQSLGITISLDDFGSGYSSLSYLCLFPISDIKIDPLFIRKLHHRDRLTEIVQNTINLVQDLQLNVIVEGVETAEQLAFLLQTGCRSGQGFLFSRPLAPALIERQLSSSAFLDKFGHTCC